MILSRSVAQRLIMLGFLLALLSSCSNVPTSLVAQVPTAGPVEQGQLVANNSADQFIRVIARPPREGMNPTEIVQGFLEASASFDSDHAVARSYLTSEAATTWDPSAGVAVYEGAPTLVEAGSAVLMSSTLTGRISDIGRFAVEPVGTELRTSFFLTQRGGEWRINRAPEGLLLSSFDVNRAYRSYSVYFFNPSFETLVPDPRLIPVIGPALATTLVQRLLEGPNAWLRPAVRTGFPEGVQLEVEAVPIENGIARVSLPQATEFSSDAARVAMSQQIVWTLRQLPEIQAVEVLAGGAPLVVPGVQSPHSRDAWPSVDPSGLPRNANGYVSTSTGVIRLTPEGNFGVAGAFGIQDLGLVMMTVSRDGSRMAGLNGDGEMLTSRLLVGSTAQAQPEADNSRSVAFDGAVNTWFVDALGVLYSIGPSGQRFPIEVQGLADEDTLLGVFPSRDSSRAALIVDRGAGSVVLLARVTRPSSVNITKIVLEEPIRVESRLTDVVSLAWSSSNTIALIGSESAGALQVFEVDLARGEVSAQGAPEDPVSIAAAPGLPTLVAAADGLVYENSSGTWLQRVRGVTASYPG